MSGKGFLGALEGLGIIETTGETPDETTTNATGTPATTPVAPTAAMPNVVQAAVNADPEMVTKIKAAVTASTHAPRLTSFLQNLETAKAAFPNDQKSAVNAALAFSKLTSADIREELTKAVAAALIEAETKIRRDISQARERLAGELDTEAEKHRGTISNLEEQISALQGQLTTAKTALSQIDTTRATSAGTIDKDETTGLASLAAVKTELASISNLLP